MLENIVAWLFTLNQPLLVPNVFLVLAAIAGTGFAVLAVMSTRWWDRRVAAKAAARLSRRYPDDLIDFIIEEAEGGGWRYGPEARGEFLDEEHYHVWQQELAHKRAMAKRVSELSQAEIDAIIDVYLP